MDSRYLYHETAACYGRDVYWDTLKSILITLVVIGHFTEINNPAGGMNRAIFNFIYLFHMPLFVFVSGRFSHLRDRAKYRKGIFKLLETFLLFQIIATILFRRFSIGGILTPWFHLWYLLTLIYYRLIIYLAPPRLLDNQKLVMLVAIITSLLGGFFPFGRLLSIQRTLAFLPFFFVGYFSVSYDFKKIVKTIPLSVAVSVLFMVFGLICLFFNKDITKYLICADPYYCDNIIDTFSFALYRGVYIVIASFVSLMIFRIIHANKKLAEFGKGTMIVFVFHIFVMILIKEFIVMYGWSISTIWILIYAMSTICALTWLSRFRISAFLLNPITSFITSFNNRRKTALNKNE